MKVDPLKTPTEKPICTVAILQPQETVKEQHPFLLLNMNALVKKNIATKTM